jgi:hypothetical protein
MENKWIILTQYGISIEPAWWGNDDKPVLFDSEEEATKYMNEDFSYDVERQKEEVAIGSREPDEVDEECEEWVSSCAVDENGCISTPDDGEIYNPKTFVR